MYVLHICPSKFGQRNNVVTLFPLLSICLAQKSSRVSSQRRTHPWAKEKSYVGWRRWISSIRQAPQTHLNDDALTPVLLLKATREEIHKGLHTEKDEKWSIWTHHSLQTGQKQWWNKQIMFNIKSSSVSGDTDEFRCHTYLCGGINCEQRDGVHAAGRGDVQNDTFGPEGKHNNVGLGTLLSCLWEH